MADGLARQIAGLAGDIRNLGRRIPSYQRGVVANVSPPTVIMDRDVTATPRPVADVLVPGLAVGQRVEVRVIGSRRVITSIHPDDIPPLLTDTGFQSVPGSGPGGWSQSGSFRVKNGFATLSISLDAASDRPLETLIGVIPADSRWATSDPNNAQWFLCNIGNDPYRARLFNDGRVNVYGVGPVSTGTSLRGSITYPVG